MNVILWITAGLLAVFFLASGTMKLAQSRQKLVASGMGALEGFGDGAVKGIGALEVLAAVGLILPAALDVAPVLVPLAAVGVALLMAGAMIAHLRRREIPAVAMTLLFLALSVLVAWGRFGPESFTG
ncbi:DoxX family protein [Actinomadura darangshiensis]|uniref:DoxX family protein n=1 Tax=Actinomadura darangshiensis TaxID=705336 RepID=A0A4R5AM72_9ACTN|nr:DoxX family protein [Actinomadura darangshiensis]TDD72770.1 DoxX family protein [Actinomadura darangshiensis]